MFDQIHLLCKRYFTNCNLLISLKMYEGNYGNFWFNFQILMEMHVFRIYMACEFKM